VLWLLRLRLLQLPLGAQAHLLFGVPAGLVELLGQTSVILETVLGLVAEEEEQMALAEGLVVQVLQERFSWNGERCD
jgi:CBS-domain-containing membrane protein